MAALVLWVREAGSGRLSVCEAPPGGLVRELLPAGDVSRCDFYVKCDGRRVSTEEALQSGVVYSVEPRLRGGKGGFGSMLRALGAQIEKTTNREACRDLSGRRLRDVNHEKAMAEWIKKQAEREAEKEQRRLERLKRKLAEPKHYFTDPEYHRQCSDMSERLEDSVIKGLQASSSSAVSADSSDTRKRRKEVKDGEKPSGKKQCLWTGLEGLEASSSSDSSSESDYESPSTSASCSSAGQRPQTSDSDADVPCCSTTAAAEQSPECIGARSSVAADEQHSFSNIATEPGTAHRQPGGPMSTDRGDEQAQRSSGITTTTLRTAHREEADSMPASTDRGDEQAQRSYGITTTTLRTAHREEADSMPASTDRGDEQAQRSYGITTTTLCTAHREEADSMPASTDRGDEQAQRSSGITTTTLCTAHREEADSMPASTDREHPNTNPQAEKPCVGTQQGSPSADSASFDLLAFTSASELQALGLEKLKAELMVLGLKCGGTLQERAARLFSVRGLTREQMDPSLVAKPSKGKKK